MSGTPEFWLVAGPNGAGKTTLTQREPIVDLLANTVLLNADDKTLEILLEQGFHGFADVPAEIANAAFIDAANHLVGELKKRLSQGQNVCVETVLSTEKYKTVVESVVREGGFFGLIYVALRNPELAIARIAARVRAGGHSVAIDRVVARWHRSIELLPWFVSRSHKFWVFDNSNEDMSLAPSVIAEGGCGIVKMHDRNAIPEITKSLTQWKTL